MTNFVSIITVNFNGKRFLKDFLNSTFIQDCPKENYEVIVVDNGSTDDSIIYIEKNFPKVRIIKSEKNLGFGVGNNHVIPRAGADGAREEPALIRAHRPRRIDLLGERRREIQEHATRDRRV